MTRRSSVGSRRVQEGNCSQHKYCADRRIGPAAGPRGRPTGRYGMTSKSVASRSRPLSSFPANRIGYLPDGTLPLSLILKLRLSAVVDAGKPGNLMPGGNSATAGVIVTLPANPPVLFTFRVTGTLPGGNPTTCG